MNAWENNSESRFVSLSVSDSESTAVLFTRKETNCDSPRTREALGTRRRNGKTAGETPSGTVSWSQKQILTIDDYFGSVCCTWSPGNQEIAFGGETSLIFYDLESESKNKFDYKPQFGKGVVRSIHWGQCYSDIVLLGLSNGCLASIDVSQKREICSMATLVPFGNTVEKIQFAPKGRFFVALCCGSLFVCDGREMAENGKVIVFKEIKMEFGVDFHWVNDGSNRLVLTKLFHKDKYFIKQIREDEDEIEEVKTDFKPQNYPIVGIASAGLLSKLALLYQNGAIVTLHL